MGSAGSGFAKRRGADIMGVRCDINIGLFTDKLLGNETINPERNVNNRIKNIDIKKFVCNMLSDSQSVRNN